MSGNFDNQVNFHIPGQNLLPTNTFLEPLIAPNNSTEHEEQNQKRSNVKLHCTNLPSVSNNYLVSNANTVATLFLFTNSDLNWSTQEWISMLTDRQSNQFPTGKMFCNLGYGSGNSQANSWPVWILLTLALNFAPISKPFPEYLNFEGDTSCMLPCFVRSTTNLPPNLVNHSRLHLRSKNSYSRRRMAYYRASASSNDGLIDQLKRKTFRYVPILSYLLTELGIIQSQEVENAMRATDRGFYSKYKGEAYQDHPHDIGWGATISAPHMHAHCLEVLKNHLRPGSKVLDVGSGSGYLSACFARMVGQVRWHDTRWHVTLTLYQEWESDWHRCCGAVSSVVHRKHE